jgi:hypothetical protein
MGVDNKHIRFFTTLLAFGFPLSLAHNFAKIGQKTETKTTPEIKEISEVPEELQQLLNEIKQKIEQITKTQNPTDVGQETRAYYNNIWNRSQDRERVLPQGPSQGKEMSQRNEYLAKHRLEQEISVLLKKMKELENLSQNSFILSSELLSLREIINTQINITNRVNHNGQNIESINLKGEANLSQEQKSQIINLTNNIKLQEIVQKEIEAKKPPSNLRQGIGLTLWLLGLNLSTWSMGGYNVSPIRLAIDTAQKQPIENPYTKPAIELDRRFITPQENFVIEKANEISNLIPFSIYEEEFDTPGEIETNDAEAMPDIVIGKVIGEENKRRMQEFFNKNPTAKYMASSGRQIHIQRN